MVASKAACAVLCAGLALAGCGRQGGKAAAPAPQGQAEADPGYRGPPQPTGVIRAADGTVTLSGHALPSAKVRLVSPAGARVETTADGSGAWTAPLGPVSEPVLYRLAQEAEAQKPGSEGQRIEAEGYVAVLPGTAAVLRAGAGARSLEPDRPGVRILAVDFDTGGAAVVSGHTAPSSPLRVSVGGVLAVEGSAGADGRFSLTLPKPLAPGGNTLQLSTPQGAAEAKVTVSPPAPPTDGPYKAVQDGGAWRVDWLTPGGGPQTTLLLGG